DCPYFFTADGRRAVRGFGPGKARLDQLSGVVSWRLHDLRRVGRSLLSRIGISNDVAEMCLGHTLPTIRKTYDWNAHYPEKKHAVEALAAEIERIVHPPEGNVVKGLRAEPMTRIRRPTRKRREVTPPTQTLQPSLFINENKFFPPLVQQVPTKERMLGGNVTGAELKHVLEANAKALRHGGKPTTLGYGTDWATIQERAAKRLRVKSEQLKAHERDRPAEKDRRRRKWNAMDAAIRKDEPDLTKRDRAKKIAARLGGSWRVIE